ncbi:hypothetical protein WA026_008484 [Henosepilachna vigintioctopunctata]|uniref:Helix-turn-helix domain-containing protein n=1 Tax=Henosepilachna vigintioctopunctata TaxID=420089 RepID=A0AAW1UFN3_9CUCU
MKLNIIKNLKTRILRIPHNSLKIKNLQILKTLLLKNGYSDTLINKLLFKTPNAGLPDCDPNDQDTGEPPTQQRMVYLTLPYMETLTHKLRNILPRDGIKVATRNVKPFKSIFSKVKDKDDL